jgi:hypothetical protein
MRRAILLILILPFALGSQISGQSLLKNNRIPNDLLITVTTAGFPFTTSVTIKANGSWKTSRIGLWPEGGGEKSSTKAKRIPRKTLRSLIAEFERVEFFRFGKDFPLEDGSEMGRGGLIMDAGTLTISIRINGQSKEVSNYLGFSGNRTSLLMGLRDKINAAVTVATAPAVKVMPVPKRRKT